MSTIAEIEAAIAKLPPDAIDKLAQWLDLYRARQRRGESGGTQPGEGEDIFVEMRPVMVDVPDVDDSREAIYSRVAGE